MGENEMSLLAAARPAAVSAVAALLAAMICPPTAASVGQPAVDPSMVPADSVPGPEQPMRQSSLCASPVAVSEPDVARPSPGFAMLNIADAWHYSTGNGVAVAVIDTGVTPNPRLPVVAGGDYITGGDGLSDCDAHGTIVASVIAAAPRGAAMPPPMPPTPSFPPVGTAPPGPHGREVAAHPPAVPDGVSGVAPHATLISIRQSSRAFEPQNPGRGDIETQRKAGTVATLARAIVHAANLGAKVINVSVTSCVSAAELLDQGVIGAAVWHAATVKDAVVVAAAGNEGEDGCAGNDFSGPGDASDTRRWNQVKTVSLPSWFSDYVLSVGGVDPTGAPTGNTLAGPWVGAAAPAVGIVGLSPQTGLPVNAYPPARPGEKALEFHGTSFAAAYVSGIAALVRARFPELSAHQVIRRIQQTAHNPARGVDNHVGYGLVDPVAALTFNVPPGPRLSAGAQTRVVVPPAAPPPPDHRARNVALVYGGSFAALMLLVAMIARARRAR